jgi:hypothetical protein
MPADDRTQEKVATRQAAVLRAAASGFTPAQIAQTVDGVTSAKMAAQDLRRGLASTAALRKLDPALLRQLELMSLASVQVAVEGVLRRAAAQAGKGDQMVLAAAGRLMQIADRRFALEGILRTDGERPPDELAARRNRIRRRAG